MGSKCSGLIGQALLGPSRPFQAARPFFGGSPLRPPKQPGLSAHRPVPGTLGLTRCGMEVLAVAGVSSQVTWLAGGGAPPQIRALRGDRRPFGL